MVVTRFLFVAFDSVWEDLVDSIVDHTGHSSENDEEKVGGCRNGAMMKWRNDETSKWRV